jgi:V-ATPase subunit C
MDQYEKLVEKAAIPRSARFMDLEDKDGYQLWRFVVLTTKVDNYLNEARKTGMSVKRFQYDFQKYKLEQETKVKLEHQMESLKVTSLFP